MTVGLPPIQETIQRQDGTTPQTWLRWFNAVFDFITNLETNHFENIVIVKQASDLTNIDSTKTYLIDGTIDMSSTSIIVPPTGLNLAGLNGSRDVSKLFSSEDNYTMFTTEVGSYSGNVVLNTVTMEVTGTSSKVYDLDNAGNGNALDIVDVNYLSCTSLGELTAYRQLLMSDVGFLAVQDGLTFSGTWLGGMTIISSIAVNLPAVTLLKEGTSLSFLGSVRSDINFLSVDAASVLLDFSASDISLDGGVTLSNVRSGATDAAPNLLGSNVKARYRDCQGIKNTYVGGEFAVSSTAVTVIASSGVLVKMAGTTTYADLQWFSQTTNNAFVYDSTQQIEIQVEGALTFTNSSNKLIGIQVKLWDNSASAYVDVGSRFTATIGSGGRAENVTFFARTTIDKSDRVEIWLENQTDTSNITAEVGGFVGISERAP